MSKHFAKIGNDELYSRQLETVQDGHRIEAAECKDLSDRINAAEIDLVENSVGPELMQEAVQMERMVLSIEQNSLRVSHTLDDVNRQMSSMSKASGGQDLKDIEQEIAEVDVLSEEEVKKMESSAKNIMMHSASKMHNIFSKGKSNYDSVVDSLSGGKPESEPVEKELNDDEDSEKQMTMMLSPLQVKITKLKMDNEMAHSKARSSEIQRAADKKRFDQIIAEYEAETQILLSKVAVAQSSKRFKEQVGRDENNSVGAVSIYEHEELKKEMQKVQEDLAKAEQESKDKDLSLAAMASDLKTAQFDLQTSQDVRSKLQKTNNEMAKKEAHFTERITEAVQKHEEKSSRLEIDLERVIADLSGKQRELDSAKEELVDLRAAADKSINEIRRLKGETASAMQSMSDSSQSTEILQNKLQAAEAEIEAMKELLTSQQLGRNDEAVKVKEKDVIQPVTETVMQPVVQSAVQSTQESDDQNAELITALQAAEAARKSAENSEQEAKLKLDELLIELAAEKAKDKSIDTFVEEVAVNDADRITEEMVTDQSVNLVDEPIVVTELSTTVASTPKVISHSIVKDGVGQTAEVESLKATISSLKQDLLDLQGQLHGEYKEKLRQYEDEVVLLKKQLAKVESQLQASQELLLISGESPREIVDAIPDDRNDVVKEVTDEKDSKEKVSDTSTTSRRGKSRHRDKTMRVPCTSAACQTDPPAIPPAQEGMITTSIHQTDPLDELQPKRSNEEVKVPKLSPTITEITEDKSGLNVDDDGGDVVDNEYNSEDEDDDGTMYEEVHDIHHVDSDSPVTVVRKKKIKSKKSPRITHEAPSIEVADSDDVNAAIAHRKPKMKSRQQNPKVAHKSKSPKTQSIGAATKPSEVKNQGTSSASDEEVENKEKAEEETDNTEEYCYQASKTDTTNALNTALKDIIASSGSIMGHVSDKERFVDDLFSSISVQLFSNGKCTLPAADVLELQIEVNKMVEVVRGSLSKFMVHENTGGGTNNPAQDPLSEGLTVEEVKDIYANQMRVKQIELEDLMESKKAVEVNLNYRDQQLQEAGNKIIELTASEQKLKSKCDEAMDKIYILMQGQSAARKSMAITAASASAPGGNLLLDKKQKLARQKTVAEMIIKDAESKESVSKKDNTTSETAGAGGFNSVNFLKTVAIVKKASSKLKAGRAARLLDGIRDKEVSIIRDFVSKDDDDSNDDDEVPRIKSEQTALMKERQKVLQTVKQDLIASMGEIKSKNFEKLCIGKYGTDDIIFLTRFQFFVDSLNPVPVQSDSNVDSRDTFRLKTLSVKKKTGAAIVGAELQKRAAVVELNAQQKLVLNNHKIDEIAKYLHATEKDLLLHSSFSAWQKLERMRTEGNFIDCLSVHRNTLKLLIEMAGGYKSALRDIQKRRQPMEDTSFWDEHFRVKVLEHCRSELNATVSEEKQHHVKLRQQVKELENEMVTMRNESDAQRSWALKQIASMSKQLKERINLPPSASDSARSELQKSLKILGVYTPGESDGALSEAEGDEEFDVNSLPSKLREVSQENSRGRGVKMRKKRISCSSDNNDEDLLSDFIVPVVGNIALPIDNNSTPVILPASSVCDDQSEKHAPHVVGAGDIAHPVASSSVVSTSSDVPFSCQNSNLHAESTTEFARPIVSTTGGLQSLQVAKEVVSIRQNGTNDIVTESQDQLNDIASSTETNEVVSGRQKGTNDVVTESQGQVNDIVKEVTVDDFKEPVKAVLVASRLNSRQESLQEELSSRDKTHPNDTKRKRISHDEYSLSRDKRKPNSGRKKRISREVSGRRITPTHQIDISPKNTRNNADGHTDIVSVPPSRLPSARQSSRVASPAEQQFVRLSEEVRQRSISSNVLPQRIHMELHDLSMSLYRKKRAGIPLAQALISVLKKFESRDECIQGLGDCISLCRPDTEDAVCIRDLRNIAEQDDLSVLSAEIGRHVELMSEALDCCLNAPSTFVGVKDDLEEKRKVFFFCEQCNKQNFPYEKFGVMKRARSYVEAVEHPDEIDDESDEEDNQVEVRIKTVYLEREDSDFFDRPTSNVDFSKSKSIGAQSIGNDSFIAPDEKFTVVKVMETHSCQTEPIHISQEDFIDNGQVEHDLQAVCTEVVKSSTLRVQEEDEDAGDVLIYVQIRHVENDMAARTASIGMNEADSSSRDECQSPGYDSPGSRHSYSRMDSDYDSPMSRQSSRTLARQDSDDAFNVDAASIYRDYYNVGVELSSGIKMISNVITVVDPETYVSRVLKLPPNVVLVKKRKKKTPLFKGILEWSNWEEMNLTEPPDFPPNVIAVEIPPILDLNKHVHLLCDSSLPFNLDIPKDTWVVAVRREHVSVNITDLYHLLPKSFLPVTLSPTLSVSSDLMERLEPNKFLVEAIPHEVTMIQNRYAMMPVGFMFTPGITLAEARCLPPKEVPALGIMDELVSSNDVTDIDSVRVASDNEEKQSGEEKKEGDEEKDIAYVPLTLPPGVLLVNIEAGCSLPSYLRLLKLEDSSVQVGIEEERHECRLEAEAIMYGQSITVLECPSGVNLLPGMLIIKRPLSLHGNPLPLPPTVTLCPPDMIPKKLKLKNNIEVVQLCPYFSFPDGIKLSKGVEIYKTPGGLTLEPGMVLVRRYPSSPWPPYCRPGVIPYHTDDIFLPPDVEAMYLPAGSRLPLGTEIMPKVTVVDIPQFDMDKLSAGVYVIHREGSEKLKSRPLPVGFMACPSRMLPHDVFLSPDIEIVYFRPQFVLPAGVVVVNGATLSRDIQLPPGLEILPNVEVIKWPAGVYLPSNFECVKKVNKKLKFPADVIIVDERSHELCSDKNAANIAPPYCYFIRIPNKVTLPCAAELTEQCVVAAVPPLFLPDGKEFHFPPDVIAIKRVGPKVFNTKHKLNQNKFSVLPPEFIRQSSRILPPILAEKIPSDVILVKVFSHFEIPEGVEIAPNVFADSRVNSPNIPMELVVVNKLSSGNMIAKPGGVQKYPLSVSPVNSDYCGYWYNNDLHNVVSFGVGQNKFRPIRYPVLPQGYFLVNQLIHAEDEAELPSYLEMVPVEKESDVCAGLCLPPGTRIVKLLPIHTLPFGICLESLEAFPSSRCLQFCPGDATGVHDREFYPAPLERVGSFFLSEQDDESTPPLHRVNTLVSAKMRYILSRKPSMKPSTPAENTFDEDFLVLSDSFLKPLSHRIIEQLLDVRLHTLDRGKNFGYINATILPPPDIIGMMVDQAGSMSRSASRSDSRQDLYLNLPNRNNVRPFNRQLPNPFIREIKSGRPVSRQLSRAISKIFKKNDVDRSHMITEQLLEQNQRDLEKALHKLESVEEELEESLKHNRQLIREKDALAKELASFKRKLDRITSHTAALHDETQAARDERNKAQAQLTMETTMSSGKIDSLTAEKRNLTYVLAETKDNIAALQEQIQFMKDNNGSSRLQAAENLRKQQIAVNSAVSEYRKLLKIGASSAFDAVRAVRDFCSQDKQMFSHMKFPRGVTQIAIGDDDSLSVLTEDDDRSFMLDDMSSLNRKVNFTHDEPAMSGSMSLSELPKANESFLPNLHDGAMSTRSLPRAKTSSGDVNRRGKALAIDDDARGRLGRQQMTTIDIMKKEKKKLKQNAGEIFVDESHLYSISNADAESVNSVKSKSIRGPRKKATCDLSVTSLLRNTNAAKQQQQLQKQQQQQQKIRDEKCLAGLDLLDATVRNPYHIDIDLSPIEIEAFLDELDKTFVFKETVVDTTNMSVKELELHKYAKQGFYVLDEERAKKVSASWLQNAVNILSACLGSNFKSYASAVVLLEKEIGCHVSDKRKMNHRIEHLEDKYRDAVSKTETSHEALQSFRIEEMRQEIEELSIHIDNIRRMSTEPLLTVLTEQAKLLNDLESQGSRLLMCSQAIDKKVAEESLLLKRPPIDDDAKRKAQNRYVEWLKKRATEIRTRHDSVQSQMRDISTSVRAEFETFEGTIQNIIPASTMMKVLNYGVMLTNRTPAEKNVVDSIIVQDAKLLESSGFVSHKTNVNAKGGRMLNVDDFVEDEADTLPQKARKSENNRPPLLPNLSQKNKNESTPLEDPSGGNVSGRASSRGSNDVIAESTGDGVTTVETSQGSARASSRPGSKQGSFRDLKGDPFNRSFTEL